jgi:rod shape-determining protein MreD
MKWLVSGAAVLILFILQLAFADLQVLGGAPNLVLLYLCYILLFGKLGDALYLALFAGLLMDIFSAYPDGVMVGAVVVALAASQYLGQVFFTERWNQFLILVYASFSTTIFFLAVTLAAQALSFFHSGQLLDWNELLLYKLGSDMILNLLFLYPVYKYYSLQLKIQNRFRIKE